MKARTMVYLEPEQLEELRTEARTRRVSLAALIRGVVQRHLDGKRGEGGVAPEAYSRIVGMGASGASDVSERHDHYLGQALHDERAD